MDRPRSNRVNGNAAEAQLIREKERAMTDIATHNDRIATIGMDLGKRSFHLIGMDARGANRHKEEPQASVRALGFVRRLLYFNVRLLS